MNATLPELMNLYQAAVDYQRSYRDLRDAADKLAIMPLARRNGLPLYRPEDVARMNEHLASPQQTHTT